MPKFTSSLKNFSEGASMGNIPKNNSGIFNFEQNLFYDLLEAITDQCD